MFRLLVFVPYVLAEVTVGIMWQLILQPQRDGRRPADRLGAGWPDHRHGWPTCDVVIWTMLFILTWKYTGFALILFLAGLANIPDELTEAAAIDGASWWQIQRHITIPLLGPTIRIWMFLSMIGSLQVFDVIWVASSPAVRSLGASNTMATYMVDHGFNQREWGYGNAVAVILFVISFVAALLFQRFVLRRDIEGAHDPKGELSMAATAALRPPRARPVTWGTPLTYVLALAVAAVSIAPVVYVILERVPHHRPARRGPGRLCPTRGSGRPTPTW